MKIRICTMVGLGILALFLSCNAETFDSGTDGNVGGDGDSDGDSDNDNGTDECGDEIPGVLRDFKSSHPDFEAAVEMDPGIVESELGADKKPVYAGGTGKTTHGKELFDQWYRDVPGVNETFTHTIKLVSEKNGSSSYDTTAFFPIDGKGFGNEGNAHNYHFTYEMHVLFTYKGGETFEFRGDDDLWIFVNDRLALDLGGIHKPVSGEVDFDAMADELQIETGNDYEMDIFFAERHTVESNFRIVTTIECFSPPPP